MIFKKLLSVFLATFCILVLLPIGSVKAETLRGTNLGYEFVKEVSEDKQSVKVNLNVTVDEGFEFTEILLPDDSVVTGISATFNAFENKKYDFKVKYKKVDELFEEILSVDVSEIVKSETSSENQGDTSASVSSLNQPEALRAPTQNKFIVSFTTPPVTEEYGLNKLTNSIKVDGTTLTSPIEGAYLILSFPTLLREENSTEIITNKFLDLLNVNIGNVANSAELLVDSANNTTSYKINLKTVDSSTEITIPFNFSFTDRLTPNGYTLTPTVKAYTADGNLISDATDATYKMKYQERVAVKKVNGIQANGTIIQGGSATFGNTNYIDPAKAEYVAFTYDLTYGSLGQKGARLNDKTTIIDTLPTYIDANGQEKTAYFNPAINPGWVLSSDGKAVSYTYNVDTSGFNGDLTRIDTRNQLVKIGLYLSFPNAPVKENGKYKDYVNEVTIESSSFNGNDTYTQNDSVSFKIDATAVNGNGLISKGNINHTVVFDKYGLHAERLQYLININNNLPYNLKNYEIIEDASKYDSRLYITKVVKISDSTNKNLNDLYQIVGVRTDGSTQVFAIGDELNTTTQNTIKGYVDSVNNGTLTPENVPTITDIEFPIVKIVRKDGTPLSPSEAFSIQVLMNFKNPYALEYSDVRNIVNKAQLTGEFENVNGQTTKIEPIASAAKYFVPLSEKISMNKITNSNVTLKPGSIINLFNVIIDLNWLSKNRLLNNPTIIDLLPAGLNITPNTRVGEFFDKNRIESVEYIENYNNTGRTAIKIKLKTARVVEFSSTDIANPYKISLGIYNIQVNEKAIPAEAENDSIGYNNDNHVYFFEDFTKVDSIQNNVDIASTNRIIDTLDIDLDGSTSDNILEATSKVKVQMPSMVFSRKYIRSLEGASKNDAIDTNKSWSEAIHTNYDSGVSGGKFQYKLEVTNNTSIAVSGIEIYDVFPFVGDNRNSAFSNKLLGPIVDIKENTVDASNKYVIYYTTDANPSLDANVAINNQIWKTQVDDYTKVTAIKIVMKSNEKLNSREKLNIILNMSAPEYDSIALSNAFSINNFQVRYSGSTTFGSTNSVRNYLPEYRYIDVKKEWVGNSLNSVVVKLLRNNVEIKTQTIDASSNWKYTFEDLEVNDSNGNMYSYTVKEVENPDYKANISGNMNDGFVIKNISQEKVEIPVSVEWIGKILPSTTVNLLLDGVVVDSLPVNATGNWQALFKVNKYDGNGNEINLNRYTLTEMNLPEHKIEIKGDAINGFKVINTYIPKSKPNVTITKTNSQVSLREYRVPDTGDKNTIAIYIVLLIVAMGGIVFVNFKRRK